MGQEELSNFKSFVVRTQNVAKELVSTASNYGVKASNFDFNLLAVQTFIVDTESNSEPEEILADELHRLEDEDVLSNPNIQITQNYELEIVQATIDEDFPKLALSIGANPSMTRLFASIKPGSEVTYFDGIEGKLQTLINKRKLRANMFINIWDKELKSEIQKFVASVQVAKTLKVDTRISFEVGHSLDSVETVDDKLILHYEKKEEETDKVDYVNRGYIQGVVEGEVLIEYIKPRKGGAGRNCRGEFIEANEPIVKNEPSFSISDKIEIAETAENMQYLAKNGGYVVLENGMYDIRVEVEVTEINFKTTGSISAGIDSDVIINVKETDAFKDAIGEGMEVAAKEINVDGNVGNNAKLKARKIVIGGQTHQSSLVEGDEVDVKIHKGMAKGRVVKVERLEQGIIEAESVTVAQATGGKIIAKEVFIEQLVSHVDIIASSKIEIKNFLGEENTFTISPVLYEEEKKSLSGNEEEIVVQKRKIRAIDEELGQKQKILEDNRGAIAELKKRLENYKKSNAKMPGSFVIKFKEFQALQQNVISLKKELTQNREKLDRIGMKINTYQDNIFQAKIINHGQYKGHNEIRFKMLEPELELYHVPQGGTNEKCFMLKEDEENETYKIVGSDSID